MARFSSRVLSATELLHDQFVAAFDSNHFRLHRYAVDDGFANFDALFATDHQYSVKHEFIALGGSLAKVNSQLLPLFHSKLLATIGNDRVHGSHPTSNESI
jgi:iron uptake system EfeUOB component EfeO/EfeM